MADAMDIIIPVVVIVGALLMIFKGSTRPGTISGVKDKITKGGGGGGGSSSSSSDNSGDNTGA